MVRKEMSPRGYVPMLIGRGKERESVLVHTNLFKHPCFVVLLEMAAEEFGYDQRGILRIPCSVELFLSVINAVEKAKSWHFVLSLSLLSPFLFLCSPLLTCFSNSILICSLTLSFLDVLYCMLGRIILKFQMQKVLITFLFFYLFIFRSSYIYISDDQDAVFGLPILKKKKDAVFGKWFIYKHDHIRHLCYQLL